MKKRKLYKYVGRNGEIVSPILLDDVKHIPLVELRPDDGFILTNGEIVKDHAITIHIDEVNEWKEVKTDTIE